MALQVSAARRQRIAAVGFDYASQPKREVLLCNLCGGSEFRQLTKRDRYGYPAVAQGCLRCGLIFLNPVMTADAYASFYAHVYRPLVSAYHGRRIDAQTIQGEQREYAGERATLLAPFLEGRRSGALLDIGGSTGVVAEEFASRFGLRATVLDPSPLEVAEARRRGLETVTALLEAFVPERLYEMVTMCQTVDHLLDVAGATHKVRQLLVEDGLFFVDIVDVRSVCVKNGSLAAAIKIDHPYSLTDMTMRAYLARGGFEILISAPASDALHLSYVCRPATSRADALPPASEVAALWREIQLLRVAEKL